MSRFEKIFWVSIAILVLVWGFLQFQAHSHLKTDQSAPSATKPVYKEVIKHIVTIVDDNHTMHDRLQAMPIEQMLHSNQADLNQTIQTQVDNLFDPVYKRIDPFLDYHYSVIGEYSELGLAAGHKLQEAIRKRLLGEEFDKQVKALGISVDQHYRSLFQAYANRLGTTLFAGLNPQLNAPLILSLDQQIKDRITLQKIKLGAVVGTAIGVKIVSTIVAKIGAKMVTKGAIKGSAKVAASSEAASAGTLCGPLAWICAPLAAGVVWFGSDKVILQIDEKLHRKEMKQELIAMIDAQKAKLIHSLTNAYSVRFKKDSDALVEFLQKQTIKRKVKKRVIERIRIH